MPRGSIHFAPHAADPTAPGVRPPRRTSVQAGIEKPLVGGYDDNQCEWNDHAEQHCSNEHSAIAATSPRCYAERAPRERERRLHDGCRDGSSGRIP